MTSSSIIIRSGTDTLTASDTIDAVLFDLSGTLLDEGYARHACAAVATAMFEQWGIDRDVASTDIRQAMTAVSAEMADRRFYLMRDVMCAAFGRVISAHRHNATARQLVALDRLMWSEAIPTAAAAEGAIETIAALRSAGIRTGIVSYADIGVFEGLLARTGLAGLTDIEVCSEMARSCKPDPAIFLMALDGIGVPPARAMFVGDSVESDVVGGNRVGMRTVLLSGREFAIGGASSDDPITHPDYHIDKVVDVLDLLESVYSGCTISHRDYTLRSDEHVLDQIGGRPGDCGHIPQVEQREQTLGLVGDFLGATRQDGS